MKRRIYTTTRERKIDQLAGFVTFPAINVVLWLVAQLLAGPAAIVFPALSVDEARIYLLLTAWSLNGLVLLFAFIFRPQFGVGYIVSIGAAMLAPFALGILFFVACFAGGAASFSGVCTMPIFCGVMLAGVLGLGWQAIAWANRWWNEE